MTAFSRLVLLAAAAAAAAAPGALAQVSGTGAAPDDAALSCSHLHAMGITTSGVYWVDPDGDGAATAPFEVYCDHDTDGGGWTLIHKTSMGSASDHTDSGHGVLTSPSVALTSDVAVLPRATINLLSSDLSNTVFRLMPEGPTHFSPEKNFYYSNYPYYTTGSHPADDPAITESKLAWADSFNDGWTGKFSNHGACVYFDRVLTGDEHFCTMRTSSVPGLWFNGKTYAPGSYSKGTAWVKTLVVPEGEVCQQHDTTPTLSLAGSGITDGDLAIAFETAEASAYTAPIQFTFVGATVPGTCDHASGADEGPYTRVVGACEDTHTIKVPVTQALNECGFSATPQDGGDTWFYEAVVEATTQEPNGTVFGVDTTRTVTTAFRVRVELPKSVDVSASAVAYGNVIQFALLSQQEVDTSSATAAFKWTLVTSVQYPYELTAKSVTEESAHEFESLGLALSAASVACPASGACTQTFEITATETTSCELTDAELKSVFTIGCRSQFTGACDTPEGVETDTATFTVSTDSFCARVVEVATVTPTLTTSTSQGGASASDFVLQTTLFGRVTFAIEAGLSVTETRLLSLDLVSEESVKPVTGAGVQDSAVVSAISFLESDQGGTAPHLDFQFQLNTESVKFAVGGGQASLTITAVVEVTYDGAGSQRFEVSTEAVSGPGSVSTAASSTVGISTPAAGGSSSTAGSTVLGVSTGTAMVAGVGLIAVVALAAGAAVAARKRRASAARRLKPASSSVELNDTAAVQV